jgi:hypothetical protein
VIALATELAHGPQWWVGPVLLIAMVVLLVAVPAYVLNRETKSE